MSTEMPDVYVKRTWSGVTGFAEGIGEPVRVASPRRTWETTLLRDRFEQSVRGDAPIEYMVCERIDDEHDCHIVDRSYDSFWDALDSLFECPSGHYIVAVRP